MKHRGSTRQSGVFVILAAGMLSAVILTVGVVLDLGRVYVFHTQLQNTADACALAAAAELNGRTGVLASPNATGVLVSTTTAQRADATLRADAAGKLVVSHWNAAYPGMSAVATLSFSRSLNNTYASAASVATPPRMVARCRVTSETGLVASVLQLFGLSDLIDYARAVATAGLMPASQVCALPLAVTGTLPTPTSLVPRPSVPDTVLSVIQYSNASGTPAELVQKWGQCSVPTQGASVSVLATLDAADSPDAAAVRTALTHRYDSAPDCASGGACARRLVVLPRVDAEGKVQDWLCMELKTADASGRMYHKGYAYNSLAAGTGKLSPFSNCVAAGVPGTQGGPFVPTLFQ